MTLPECQLPPTVLTHTISPACDEIGKSEYTTYTNIGILSREGYPLEMCTAMALQDQLVVGQKVWRHYYRYHSKSPLLPGKQRAAEYGQAATCEYPFVVYA